MGGGSGGRARRRRHAVGTRRRANAVVVDGEATLEAPARFAPGFENCRIEYEFRRGPTLQGSMVSLTIKDRDDHTIHHSGVIGLGRDRRDSFDWDGRDDAGNYVTPQKSPFTVSLKVGNAITRTRQVRVELHNIIIWTRTTNRKINMSDPAQTLDTAATVQVKCTNGPGVRAHMPVEVKFSYIAGGSNLTVNDSYQYSAGHRLGKRDLANAVFWEAHARCTTASDDHFRQTCRVTTLDSGSDRGKAFVKFKPSGVGGDTFRIKATMYWADGTTVMMERTGPVLTVWRKIHFNRIYTMRGENFINNATSEPEIDPAFETDGYTMYSRGSITTLSEALSPRYIGLYESGGGRKDWPDDLSPENLESSDYQLRPTAEELNRYNYTGTEAARVTQRNNAKTAIERKATRWFNAVVREYSDAVDAWFADAGIPTTQNVILAVKYYHPKLSGLADGATNFWPAGIQINLANPGSGLTMMGDPDRQTWRTVAGFNRGQISVIFKNYDSAAELQITCRHEIGHGTKSAFERDLFGTGDHSASALMTPYGDSNTFSNADIRILRGWHR